MAGKDFKTAFADIKSELSSLKSFVSAPNTRKNSISSAVSIGTNTSDPRNGAEESEVNRPDVTQDSVNLEHSKQPFLDDKPLATSTPKTTPPTQSVENHIDTPLTVDNLQLHNKEFPASEIKSIANGQTVTPESVLVEEKEIVPPSQSVPTEEQKRRRHHRSGDGHHKKRRPKSVGSGRLSSTDTLKSIIEEDDSPVLEKHKDENDPDLGKGDFKRTQSERKPKKHRTLPLENAAEKLNDTKRELAASKESVDEWLLKYQNRRQKARAKKESAQPAVPKISENVVLQISNANDKHRRPKSTAAVNDWLESSRKSIPSTPKEDTSLETAETSKRDSKNRAKEKEKKLKDSTLSRPVHDAVESSDDEWLKKHREAQKAKKAPSSPPVAATNLSSDIQEALQPVLQDVRANVLQAKENLGQLTQSVQHAAQNAADQLTPGSQTVQRAKNTARDVADTLADVVVPEQQTVQPMNNVKNDVAANLQQGPSQKTSSDEAKDLQEPLVPVETPVENATRTLKKTLDEKIPRGDDSDADSWLHKHKSMRAKKSRSDISEYSNIENDIESPVQLKQPTKWRNRDGFDDAIALNQASEQILEDWMHANEDRQPTTKRRNERPKSSPPKQIKQIETPKVVETVLDLETTTDEDEVFENKPLIREIQTQDSVNNGNKTTAANTAASSKKNHDPSYYFKDGERVVDYVLAYQPRLDMKDRSSMKREMLAREYRKKFEEKLMDIGLELEYQRLDKSADGKTYFIKVHAPWEFLCQQAEFLQLRTPLAELSAGWNIRVQTKKKDDDEGCFRDPTALPKRVVPDRPEHFMARFDNTRRDMFLIEDKNTFFTTIQRIRMVHEALTRTTIRKITKFDKTKRFGINVKDVAAEGEPVSLVWLKDKKIYAAAYPVHDSECAYPKTQDPYAKSSPKEIPDRHWLFLYWADFKMWNKQQPLNQIHDYLGSRIAMYFAFMGFYTKWLAVPAFIGLFAFIFGIGHMFNDPVTNEFCDLDQGNVVLCRLCADKQCPFKKLYEECAYTRFAHMSDNVITMIFAIVISLWAVLFLERWRQRQAELSANWGTVIDDRQDEVLRAEYQLKVRTRHRNPITGNEEPCMKKGAKKRRIVASGITMAFFIILLISLIVAVIIYRAVSAGIYYKLQKWDFEIISPQLATAISASIFSAIIILFMTAVYMKLARKLTELECPRTDHDFDVSYTWKVFAFQFINIYGALFYLALLKGKFAGSIADQKDFSDNCPASGCMAQVCLQLIVLFSGLQIVDFTMGYLLPKMVWSARLSRWKRANGGELPEMSRYEKDYWLDTLDQPALFSDYMHLVIQYGFLTMFASAFPLAAFIAFVCNVLDIRITARRLLEGYRRPIPESVTDIGAWFTILELLSKLAITTNALVIAFTSDFVDRAVYFTFYEDADWTQDKPDAGVGKFLNFAFAKFNTSDYAPHLRYLAYDEKEGVNVTSCWYNGYYVDANEESAYERKLAWWHMQAAKLAFVLVFQNLVSFVHSLIRQFTKEVPGHVRLKLERERYVTKQAFMKHEMGLMKYEKVYDVDPKNVEETGSTPVKQDIVQNDDGKVELASQRSAKKSPENSLFSGLGFIERMKGQPPSKQEQVDGKPQLTGIRPQHTPRLIGEDTYTDSTRRALNDAENRSRPKTRRRPWYIDTLRRFNLFC